MDNYQFSFGLVADIQYADIPDGCNFRGDEIRLYRGAKDALAVAVAEWNGLNATSELAPESKSGLDFRVVMQLGDLIDGQNSGTYGALREYCETHGSQTDAAWNRVMDVIRKSSCSEWHHLVGNHELYNFPHTELPNVLKHAEFDHIQRGNIANSSVNDSVDNLGEDGDQAKYKTPCNYYSFNPAPGWRFVVLDSYAESILGRDEDHPTAVAAAALLAKRNPNPLDGSADFTNGLKGPEMRFLPYNGALGDQQLAWLSDTLARAGADGPWLLLLLLV